jgi:hypothetical protein
LEIDRRSYHGRVGAVEVTPFSVLLIVKLRKEQSTPLAIMTRPNHRERDSTMSATRREKKVEV